METAIPRKRWQEGGLGCLAALLLFAVIAAAAVLIFLVIFTHFERKIYIGHRVKGSITVTLDGEPVSIEELTCDGEGIGRPRIDYDGNKVSYSILGNEYGVYTFTCKIEGELPTVEVEYEHFNWWERSQYDIVLELSRDDNGGYTYQESHSGRWLDEKNQWRVYGGTHSGVSKDGIIKLGY